MLEMNIHEMSLIDPLKIGGIGLDFIIMIGIIMEGMVMMAVDTPICTS